MKHVHPHRHQNLCYQDKEHLELDLLLVHIREHFEYQFHLQLAQSQHHLPFQLSIHHLIQCHQMVEQQFF